MSKAGIRTSVKYPWWVIIGIVLIMIGVFGILNTSPGHIVLGMVGVIVVAIASAVRRTEIRHQETLEAMRTHGTPRRDD